MASGGSAECPWFGGVVVAHPNGNQEARVQFAAVRWLLSSSHAFHVPYCVTTRPIPVWLSLGQAVNLTCDVESEPEVQRFNWTFRQRRTEEYVRVPSDQVRQFKNRSVLEFLVRNEEDFGILHCRAVNEVGEQQGPCLFDIGEEVKNQSGREPTFRLSGLQPGTKYEGIAWAENEKGASEATQLLISTSFPVEPNTAPAHSPSSKSQVIVTSRPHLHPTPSEPVPMKPSPTWLALSESAGSWVLLTIIGSGVGGTLTLIALGIGCWVGAKRRRGRGGDKSTPADSTSDQKKQKWLNSEMEPGSEKFIVDEPDPDIVQHTRPGPKDDPAPMNHRPLLHIQRNLITRI
ncbi:unnamed protein product [Darwinula stevensoni]|uniref:Ig-like domain-containing protein n=1 Tax=Darwinula stevensoni TaxID=69355 RepID=A0A7R9AB48_9CRUS|nr:unnamed protein product [Darwinula stevensoni]CAG0899068.1 unnamed protein product [Darwinula stevensoni]